VENSRSSVGLVFGGFVENKLRLGRVSGGEVVPVLNAFKARIEREETFALLVVCGE